MISIEVVEADLGRPDHQLTVVKLLNAYAMDPMGDGKPLSAEVRRKLIPGLQDHPTTLIFLAYRGGEAIGIAVCFYGFSTFAAKPLINISDIGVLPDHRGHGAGRQLLAAVETKAREKCCCKITLEVQENNHHAQKLYHSFGFSRDVHQEEAGGALFLSKPLLR